MYEIHPYFTNDGSVGLFSPEADDIYHSTYGALAEAYEKFVIPADLEKYFQNNTQIKVLDICFGIGYNTKSFLNFLLEKNIINFQNKNQKKQKKFLTLKQNNATIYTNNTVKQICNDELYSNNSDYNEKIHGNNIIMETHEKNVHESATNNEALYSNNILAENSACKAQNNKIFIKAIDTDAKLFYFSPFFRQGLEKDKKYNNIDFNYEKINKLLKSNFEQKYKLKNEVNLFIFKNIIEKLPEIFDDIVFEGILTSKKYSVFFDHRFIALYKLLKNNQCKYGFFTGLNAFLHNIYYRYISNRYKKALNALCMNDLIFEPEVNDARVSIKNDKNIYNLIFLDAFTPAKCPALWSLEFFKLLFEHLDEDGMILTYSNSAAVRNAMINAGFFVGKIYNEKINKFTGTIAVKNKSLIKYELSEYDLGLINSRAGIFYRDENLDLVNEAIIKAHENEVKTSDKISSSKFIKAYKKQKLNIDRC